MKKLTKRIAALVLAAITALSLGVMANAVTVSDTFTDADKMVSFKLSATVSVLSGAAYILDVAVTGANTNPYYYPSLYVKGVLYGTDSENSTASQTFTYANKGNVSVSRGVGLCNGKGYGYFHAYGTAAHGDVSGSVYV